MKFSHNEEIAVIIMGRKLDIPRLLYKEVFCTPSQAITNYEGD